jgi:phosphatidylserine/phosphatidylglycerophosphate/cardiolipin synthase-like enzyme
MPLETRPSPIPLEVIDIMRASFVRVFLLLIAVLTASAAPALAVDELCDPAYQDCRAKVLKLIADEDEGLDVAFWFMEDSRFANAIIARWRAGVPVRVIIDTKANSTYTTNVRMLQLLKDAGIPMRRKVSDYLHWKMMLFAGQNTVQFSGANYSPNAFVWSDSPYTNYVDEVIYFTSDPEVVKTFMVKYDDVWTASSDYQNYANITAPLARVYPTFPITDQSPELNFPYNRSTTSPEHFTTRSVGRYNAEDAGIDSIIYRIDDGRHTAALLAAVKRGVPVRVMTEQVQYRDKARYLHSYNIDQLYAGGVKVKFRGHLGLTHEKLTLLHEQQMAIFGSSNWTLSSANQQLEHNYFTTKPWLYSWARDHFERKWNNLGPVPETKPFVPLPPDAPSVRAPANAAVGVVGPSVALKWYAGLWAHFYDVYFGTDPNNLTKVAENASLGGPSKTTAASEYKTYTVSVQPSTTYYWKVVSKTAANVSKSGSVWSFRTEGPLPSAGDGDVVLYAGRATQRVGNWAATADSSAAGGVRMWNRNAGLAKPTAPSATPADYFELSFMADAGVPYKLWLRGMAEKNSYNNDSVFVQFSDSVSSSGASTYRIGTTAGTSVTIEECSSCGLSGWGWADNVIGGTGAPIYFASSGTHTIRIQRREDGVSIDQIVLSRSRYLTSPPGYAKNDGTRLAENGGTSGEEPPPPPPPPPALPSGWSGQDVGSTGVAGSASVSGGTFTVGGSGADIWGTADAFHYAYRSLSGDGQIVARVASLSGSHEWTKVGVMIRQSTAAGAAHASMFVSKSKGLAFQRRTAAGGVSTHTTGGTGTAPKWVRLRRVGNVITASVSSDGSAWIDVDSDTIALSGPALIGLAVTSHSTSSTATGTFDSVSITP